MTKNRYLALLLAGIALLSACQKHEEIFFDTPFARIEDANGQSTMTIDHKLDNGGERQQELFHRPDHCRI